MPFQTLIRIYDPYRRVSINRYSYYRVPTAAFRKSAFRLGGVLIFQPLGAGTTRPGGGLGAGLAAVAAGGQGGRFSRYGLLGFSWASLGSSCRFLGLSWLILGLLGPLLAHLGAEGRPKGGQGSQQEAQEGPREPQESFLERPEEPKNLKKNR